MAALAIAVKDIMLDPEHRVDLTVMPEEEAIRLIKEAYRFLSPMVEVSIQEGIAIITLPEENAQRANDALKLFNRAVRSAQRGDYQRAIQQFRQVLSVLPGHVDARRNLAMAYEETGDIKRARNHVIEALKLNPNDAWSYVLLGNIYKRHEKDYDRAERLYRRALEIAPNDVTLLTNYGALMAEKGNTEQAEELFERAIAADPKYPNSYHGLALLAFQGGQPAEALTRIDEMFTRSQSTDRRVVPVYEEARRLYLAANQAVAEASAAQLMDCVEARRRALEDRGGAPIRMVRDDSLRVSAIIETTWRHHRDHHVVRYRVRSPLTTPHLIAHELEHLALELEAREAGRNRLFAVSTYNRELALRSIADHVAELRRTGVGEAQVNQYVNSLFEGLTSQLFNAPIDMIIERRLFHGLPDLRPSQFVSLHVLCQETVNVLTHPEVRRITPPLVLKANLAMNCATALFIDDLYGGKTAYATPYRSHAVYATGQKLFRLWRQAMERFEPGDEYALVDEFARVLRLERWYEWQRDTAPSPLTFDLGGERLDLPTAEGVTNPELLKKKEPAAVMYCLDALQRFEGMDDERVRAIAFEIGLLGRFGLDYASAESKYTLNSLPGERFTGLQLMCLMYVGFKRIDPSLDIGMELEGAYRAALALYKQGR